MKNNRFLEKFKEKTDSELLEIIEKQSNYESEAVEAAKFLLNKRTEKESGFSETNIKEQFKEKEFIPEKGEYEFKYSRIYISFIISAISFCIYLGCVYLISKRCIGFSFIGIAIIGIITQYKLVKNEPEIVINEKGIWTKSLGYKHWHEIEGIIIEKKGLLKYLDTIVKEHMYVYLKEDIKSHPSEYFDLSGIADKKTLRKLAEYYTNYADSLF